MRVWSTFNSFTKKNSKGATFEKSFFLICSPFFGSRTWNFDFQIFIQLQRCGERKSTLNALNLECVYPATNPKISPLLSFNLRFLLVFQQP